MVSRFIVSLFAFAAGFLGTSVYLEANSFDTPRSSVHMVAASDQSTGTMVVIAPGLALTARHVAEHEDLATTDGIPLKVVKMSDTADLALVSGNFGCPCTPLKEEPLSIDEKVVVIGYPLGAAQLATEGRIQDLVMNSIISSAPVAPGNSGGGLFVWDGYQWKLAGILIGIAAIPFNPWEPGPAGMVTHLNISVSGLTIKEFLRDVPR